MKKIIIFLFLCLILVSSNSFAQSVLATTSGNPGGTPGNSEYCDPAIEEYITANRDVLIINDAEGIKTDIKTQPSIAPTTEELGNTCFAIPDYMSAIAGIENKIGDSFNKMVSGPADILKNLAGLAGNIIDNLKNLGAEFGGLGGDFFNFSCATIVGTATDAAKARIEIPNDVPTHTEIPYMGKVGADINTNQLRFDTDIDINTNSITSDLLSR